MAIRRTATKLDSRFTTIPNEALRDSRLTLKARGLLSLLMSHKVGWVVSIESLARENPEGKAAIRSAVNELEKYGYLQRERVHSDNHFLGYDYILSFEQVCGNRTPPFDNQTSDNQTSENQTSDNRTPKNTIPKKTIEKKTNSKETSSRKRDGGYSEEFEAFWKTYPRKNAKAAAFKAWNKLSTEEKQLAVTGAQRYANDPNRVPQFTAHGSTWLNEKRWEDAPLPARSTNQQTYEDKVAYMVNAVNQNNQPAPSLYGELE